MEVSRDIKRLAEGLVDILDERGVLRYLEEPLGLKEAEKRGEARCETCGTAHSSIPTRSAGLNLSIQRPAVTSRSWRLASSTRAAFMRLSQAQGERLRAQRREGARRALGVY